MVMDQSHPFMIGSTLAIASMFSVGPTNLMLIREGLARGRVVTMPTMVVLCYGGLLSLACAFAGEIARWPPDTREWLSWSAVGVISIFASRSLLSSARPKASTLTTYELRESRRRCIARAALIVLLNPLAYIEVLLVPASICATLKGHSERFFFASGLGIVTIMYCFLYSIGALLCANFLARPRAFRIIDLASSIALFSVAAILAHDMSSFGV